LFKERGGNGPAGGEGAGIAIGQNFALDKQFVFLDGDTGLPEKGANAGRFGPLENTVDAGPAAAPSHQIGPRPPAAKTDVGAGVGLADIRRFHPGPGLAGERVAALIRLTARHGKLAPADVDDEAARFLDCDMAILGAPPAGFDAYDRAIAAEYRGKLPGWLFEFNRRRFLKGLLAKERIFLSAEFHALLDASARANLLRLLHAPRSALRAGAGR